MTDIKEIEDVVKDNMEKIQRIYITRGIPASGKSTWAKDNVNSNTVRINRDDIRAMLGYSFDNYDANIEKCITEASNTLMRNLLKRGYNLIIDNLNLKQSYVNEIHDIAKEIGNVIVHEKHFPVDLDTALLRNRARGETVPENVIEDLYHRFKKIKRNPSVFYAKPNHKPLVQDETLPHAIICDLDGTLCLFDRDEKSPYERDFENDEVNSVVNNILWYYNTIVSDVNNNPTHIIFTSGRNDKFRDVTLDWIDRNIMDINYNNVHLIMRADGDCRRDSVVKREMFDKYIRDKYFVDFVLDDRNQVVNMWRELGLTCLQVEDGDF